MNSSKQKRKTTTLTLRVEPRLREAAELAAKKDHRSVTNLIEVLLLKRCDELGIDVNALDLEDKNGK